MGLVYRDFRPINLQFKFNKTFRKGYKIFFFEFHQRFLKSLLLRVMKRALILYKFGQLRNIFFYVNIVGSKSVENILENFGFDVSVSNEATLADAGGKIREVKFWDDDTVCY